MKTGKSILSKIKFYADLVREALSYNKTLDRIEKLLGPDYEEWLQSYYAPAIRQENTKKSINTCIIQKRYEEGIKLEIELRKAEVKHIDDVLAKFDRGEEEIKRLEKEAIKANQEGDMETYKIYRDEANALRDSRLAYMMKEFEKTGNAVYKMSDLQKEIDSLKKQMDQLQQDTLAYTIYNILTI